MQITLRWWKTETRFVTRWKPSVEGVVGWGWKGETETSKGRQRVPICLALFLPFSFPRHHGSTHPTPLQAYTLRFFFFSAPPPRLFHFPSPTPLWTCYLLSSRSFVIQCDPKTEIFLTLIVYTADSLTYKLLSLFTLRKFYSHSMACFF